MNRIYLPSGERIEKDAEELGQALITKRISQKQFQLAGHEFSSIKQKILFGSFPLFTLSYTHYNPCA